MKKFKPEMLTAIKKLEIATKVLTITKFPGKYRSVFKGKGLEFEDFRDYIPTDDAGCIDWKTSLRANKLLIKQYKEERDLNVAFFLDASSSMVFGSVQKLKYEYAAELIASLSNLIIKLGDNAGLFLFKNKIIKSIPPKKGRNQFYLITKNLFDSSLYGGQYDIENALNYAIKTLKKGCILFLVSDFLGSKHDWSSILKTASAKFDVIGIMIRDPRDEKLPAEIRSVNIKDPFSERGIQVDVSKIKEKYERHVKAEERKLQTLFIDSGADLVKLTTDKSFIKPMIEFLGRRALSLK